ncbi:MAG: hypothetical protein HYY90_05430 [Candidatus Omnitrophica bacterium]|nr:hypothetical protein [Candidatus Omnitrophota bacterium]
MIARDQYDNDATNHAGLINPIGLSSLPASTDAKFFDAATGGSEITTVSLPLNAASVDGWYENKQAGTYTIATTRSGVTNATHTLTVKSAAATRFTVAGGSSMVTGGANPITITAYDAFANVAADTYTGDKGIVLSGAGASPTPSSRAPTCTDKTGADVAFGTPPLLTFAGGVATCTMRLYKAETASIKATEGSINTEGADALAVTIRHGAADHLKFQGNIPVPLPANKFEVGVPFDLGVLMGVDQYDNLADGANGSSAYSGTRTLTYALSGISDSPDGNTPDAYTSSVSFTNGLSTTPLMTTLHYAQTTSIAAHDPQLSGTDAPSGAITLAAAPVAKLSFFQQPSATPPTNVPLSTQPKVAVADRYGNPITQASDQITLAASLTSGSFTSVTNGTLSGDALSVVTANGVATFSGIRYSYPEAIYLKASSAAGGVPDVYSFKITFSTSSDSTLNSGPLTEPTTISSSIDTPLERVAVFDFTVTDAGSDGFGTIIKQILIARGSGDATNGWLSFIAGASLSDGTASILGTVTENALTFGSGGSAIFTVPDLASKTYTLSIHLKQILPAGSDGKRFAFTIDPNDHITVEAIGSAFAQGPALSTQPALDVIATKFILSAGSSSVQAGSPIAITIKAADANNNLDLDYEGAPKELVFSGASPALTGDKPTATNYSGIPIEFGDVTLVTFADGQNSSPIRLTFYRAEATAIKAATSDSQLTTSSTDDLELVVTGGSPAKLAWYTQPKSAVAANAPWNPFKVSVTDAYENVAGSALDVAVTPTGCSTSAGSTSTAPAQSGIATFTNIAVFCPTYPGTVTLNATAQGVTPSGASIAVTVAERYAISVRTMDSVNGSPLTSITMRIIDAAGQVVASPGLTNPVTGNSPFSFALPFGAYQFNFVKDAYVETTVERRADTSADGADGTFDNVIAWDIFIMSVAESLADYRVIADFVYDEQADRITALMRIVSDAINTLKTATLEIFDSSNATASSASPLSQTTKDRPDSNGNYAFTVDQAVASGRFISGRSYFAKSSIVYGGEDLSRNVTYGSATTFNIGISARLKTLTDEIRTDVAGVQARVATEAAATRTQVVAEAQTTQAKVEAKASETQAKVAEVKADAAKILTATETMLPTKIEEARKEIETTRTAQILNRESTVKTSETLTIRYRTYPGLAPTVDVYDARNLLRVGKAPMREVSASGIYEFPVTFQFAWGKGDFTIVCSESTNGTMDAMIITVLASDIEEVAGQVAAILGSTSGIPEVKSGLSDLKASAAEMESQFSVLETALSRIGKNMVDKIEAMAESAQELEHVYGQLSRMGEQIKKLANETGLSLSKLYEVSEEKKEDIVYLKNKTQQLKAAMDFTKQQVDNIANKPITQTWFEFR